MRVSQIIEQILASLAKFKTRVLEYRPAPRKYLIVKPKDFKKLDPELQRFISELIAERDRLKAERDKLIEQLYETKAFAVNEKLSEQLDIFVKTIVTEGEFFRISSLPKAITPNYERLGRLIGFFHYNNFWYPLLLIDGKKKLITQGAERYEDALWYLDKEIAIIGWDKNGRHIPKLYA